MKLTLPAPPDFSFLETLSAHGWRRLLPFVWNDDTATLTRVEEMPNGEVATLQLRETDDGVTLETDKDTDADEMTQRVRRMLQMDVPIENFHAYCATIPSLTEIAACRKGRMLRAPTLWEDVVKVVCEVRGQVCQWRVQAADAP